MHLKWRTGLLLTLLLIVFLFVGFFPFNWQPFESFAKNQVSPRSEGGLRFQSPSIAYTRRAPSWLPETIAQTDLEISMEVRSTKVEQYGPARIFTLSVDRKQRNLTFGQEGRDLILRIRHRCTGPNGTPAYTFEDVFSASEWHNIYLNINASFFEVRIDGNTVLKEALLDQPLDRWHPGYKVALGNELTGDKPWTGDIRKAVVTVNGKNYDYLLPGALHIPHFVAVGHEQSIHKFIPLLTRGNGGYDLMELAFNLFAFVPFGWLIAMFRRPRSGVFLGMLASAGVSGIIEIGQFFLPDRFPSTRDFLLNTLGGTLGALLARHFDISIKRRAPEMRQPPTDQGTG